jgi:chaperonin GroEL
MSIHITSDFDAHLKMRSGLEKLSRAVQATMGPKGRTVILSQPTGIPHITKDGISVAKAISLADPAENAGAEFVKTAALQMASLAGDGTTTATVLAQAIFSQSLKYTTAGADTREILNGLSLGAVAVVHELKKQAQQINSREQLSKIASISANGDQETGELVAEALQKAGPEGLVIIEEAKGTTSYISLTSGSKINSGYLSSHFITNQEKQTAELEEPLLLLTDQKISSLTEILPLLERVAEIGRPLLIIAEEVEAAALSALVLNHTNKVLKVAAIKLPGIGTAKQELLEDLALLSGGTFVSGAARHRLNKVGPEHLGHVAKAVIEQSQTLLIEGKGDKAALKQQLNHLQEALKKAAEREKEKLQERITRLGGGVARINLAAHTQVEMQEKKDRTYDALGAARAALEEGFVAGGGVALIRASEALALVAPQNHDQELGLKVLANVLQQPAAIIARNAGAEARVVVNSIASGSGGWGYNAATNTFEDLFEAGIIDPLKVTRLALETALSVASLMLNTYCLLTEETEAAKSEHLAVSHP